MVRYRRMTLSVFVVSVGERKALLGRFDGEAYSKLSFRSRPAALPIRVVFVSIPVILNTEL